MRACLTVISSIVAISFLAAASAAPPEGRGGGGGGGGKDEPTVEVPTTVFIERANNQPSQLVVAGSDSSISQAVYAFSGSPYLHDVVLVSEGHGRALITDRTANPLPLIVVDFWFAADGTVTSSNARQLLERPDWGCEALSSDGSRAIWSRGGTGIVNWIDITTGSSGPLWTFDATQSFTACDFKSEDPLNGKLHAVVIDSASREFRIERIDIAAQSVATVVSPSLDEIRGFAVHYSGSSIDRVAFDDSDGIRIGSTFSAAESGSPAIAGGRLPDFYCNGESLVARAARRRNKSPTIVYALQSGSSDTYTSDFNYSQAQTLC